MYSLKTEASFDSAHFLYGYEGKCSNIHGHRWKIEAKIKSAVLEDNGPKRGMLIDFGDFKKYVRALADKYDHTLLFEEGSLKESTVAALKEEGFSLTPLPVRPTAENLAKLFFQELQNDLPQLSSVTVYETPENCAKYSQDRN